MWVEERLVAHSAQTMELGRLVGVSLLWWEQAFLVGLALWVVEPLAAHSELTMELERSVVASVVVSLVVETQEAHLAQTLEVERLVGVSSLWWEQAFLVVLVGLVLLVLLVVEQLVLHSVLHLVQSSEVDCHLCHPHGSGRASLRWWEPELLEEQLSLVEPLVAPHSEQT